MGISLDNIEDICEMSNFELLCGSQNFLLNVVLEFLELVEIVKILTIVYRSRLKFVPSPALLKKVLLKGLLSSSSGIPFHSNSQDKEAKPTLSMISEEKTLTLHTMRKLHDFIKRSIKKECKPCSTISFDSKICTFWNCADGENGLSFKVIFASSQCSDRECDKIVLWHCCMCETPCSECLIHITKCDHCQVEACKDCFVSEKMCKRCGFRCIGCETLFIEDEEPRVLCEGSRCGQPCPSKAGPYCSNCAWPEVGFYPDIGYCSKCSRSACGVCDTIMGCEICTEQFCEECDLNICHKCNGMFCFDCRPMPPCEQVKETLLTTSLFALPSYC
jgi:hypothetical protein